LSTAPNAISIRRLGPETRDAFFALHHPDNGEGWCFCMAWWTPTWDGWAERTAEANRTERDALLAAGHYDGYLAFDGDRPVGWLQAGARDRLVKLCTQFGLAPDPSIWAVTCMLLLPAYRHQRLAHAFLALALADMQQRGVGRVQAFPRVGHSLEDNEAWSGPEAIYVRAGFTLAQDGERRRVYVKELA
jgi:hypothetical protein